MPVFHKKAFWIIGTIVATALLVGVGFFAGWRSGREFPQSVVVTNAANISSGASSTDANFGIFWDAWQNINDLYLRNPSTTNQGKLYGAISGLVQSLGDPYSEFMNPADAKQFADNLSGNFGGIGAELGTDLQGDIVVIAPIKGTPAERAGLLAKDVIVAVNGSSTAGMSVDGAVNLIRGPQGTSVTLGIFRSGWDKPRDFKIVRETIQVPTVDFEMKGNIAHISLHEFTEGANQLVYEKLVQAMNANAKGIVLDLRDDPGGYLGVAVDLSGYFLKQGTLVVQEVGRSVPEQDFHSAGNGALGNLPMAILINKGSASAAEILAGALHDQGGVPLVGERSFGKGTVQEVEQLPDGSSLKLTVAHWVLPSGKILDHDGLVPDYEVPLTDADRAAHKDPQLDRAIQVVSSAIDRQPVP